MKISGIYQIQSKAKPTKIYIGCAVNIDKRWKEHIYNLKSGNHHSFKLQAHVNKYGLTDLQFSIITSCEKEELAELETFFIKSLLPYFNSDNSKYFNGSKKKLDDIFRNISKALKGNKNRLGVKDPPETRKKKSELQTGSGNSMYGVEPWNKGKKGLQKNPFKGKTGIYSEETIIKMRISQKRAWEKRKQKKATDAK